MIGFISRFTKYFLSINAATMIMMSFILLIRGTRTISVNFILEIIIASVATAIPSAILMDKEYDTKEMIIRMIIHYLIVSGIMIGLGFLFNMIPRTLLGAVIMMLSVAFVYRCSCLFIYFSTRRDTSELNKALREKYPD